MSDYGFYVQETPGRIQPFAVWRAKECWCFFAEEEQAHAYVRQEEARLSAMWRLGR